MEKVRERCQRAAHALQRGRVPYAVAGGHAVANWVSQVNEAAVRNTADVDILLRRSDLPAAIVVLEQAGFVHQHAAGIDFFRDGADSKFQDAVHLVFANEKVRPEYLLPAADVTESETSPAFQVVSLEALVRMKLTSFRIKDQTHLLDLLGVGLIDAAWIRRFPDELAARLQHLINIKD